MEKEGDGVGGEESRRRRKEEENDEEKRGGGGGAGGGGEGGGESFTQPVVEVVQSVRVRVAAIEPPAS